MHPAVWDESGCVLTGRYLRLYVASICTSPWSLHICLSVSRQCMQVVPQYLEDALNSSGSSMGLDPMMSRKDEDMVAKRRIGGSLPPGYCLYHLFTCDEMQPL